MIKAADLIAKFKSYLEAKDGYIWGTAGIKWTAEKQKAATREQTIKYGAQWIGHIVEDCSGAFSRAFKELGGYMYHGSNTMYKSYCTNKGQLKAGRRTDGIALKPGSAVFTGTENDHGHVGLYIGDGKVIEAAGTKQGVITSEVSAKKWTYWGELKGVEYEGDTPAPEPAPPDPDARPTLRKGSKGEYVVMLQKRLLELGYDLGPCGVDGNYGSATVAAVKKFQTAWNLTADGICGPKTWKQLDQSPSTKLYTVTITGLTNEQADALLSKYSSATKREE